MSVTDKIFEVLANHQLLDGMDDSTQAELFKEIRSAINGLPSIELHLAHSWDCDHCGAENFARSVTYKPSELDMQEGEIECYDPETGDTVDAPLVHAPDVVVCRDCGAMFTTKTHGQESSP